MGLVHHVVPLAVEQGVIVLIGEVDIGLEERLHARSFVIRTGASLRGVKLIAPGGNVQFGHLPVCLRGMQHQFEEGIASRGRKGGLHFFGARDERMEVLYQALGFVVIREAESLRIEQLRLAAAGVLQIS